MVHLSMLTSFLSGYKISIDTYIPNRKYQVQSHLFPWLSPSCAAMLLHIKINFFNLYQRDNSAGFKALFRQTSNPSKRVIESAKNYYTKKTKDSIVAQRVCTHDFPPIANIVLNRGKSAIPSLFNGPEVLTVCFQRRLNSLLNSSLKILILMILAMNFQLSIVELTLS